MGNSPRQQPRGKGRTLSTHTRRSPLPMTGPAAPEYRAHKQYGRGLLDARPRRAAVFLARTEPVRVSAPRHFLLTLGIYILQQRPSITLLHSSRPARRTLERRWRVRAFTSPWAVKPSLAQILIVNYLSFRLEPLRVLLAYWNFSSNVDRMYCKQICE